MPTLTGIPERRPREQPKVFHLGVSKICTNEGAKGEPLKEKTKGEKR